MKAFPAEKLEKPHLIQAFNATRFAVEHPRGGVFEVTFPKSYQQLVDCRHWNDWHNFTWSIETPLASKDKTATMKVQVRDLGGAKEFKAVVDKFGQAAEGEWVGKVKSEEELKADVETEKAYYAAFKTVDFDAYGGLAGSGEKLGLKANGLFHMEKAGPPPARAVVFGGSGGECVLSFGDLFVQHGDVHVH